MVQLRKIAWALLLILAVSLLPLLFWYNGLNPLMRTKLDQIHKMEPKSLIPDHLSRSANESTEQSIFHESLGVSTQLSFTTEGTRVLWQDSNSSHSIIPVTNAPTSSSSSLIKFYTVKHKGINHQNVLMVSPITNPAYSSPHLQLVKPDCSTVHIAMVVTGDMRSIHLHTTIKSIFIHRSTALHFHFITDGMAKTVLQTMMNTWLLPSISHDYYDLTESWHNISSRKTNSQTNCSKTLSIHLNLDRVLPNSVQHVIVIEPLSVARIDLAKIWAVTVSRSDRVITVCQTECVQYCNDGGQKIELTHWGAVGVNLVLQRKLKNRSYTEKYTSCTPSILDIIDKTKSNTSTKQRTCTSIRNFDGELLRYKKMEKCPKDMKPLIKKPPSRKNYCKLFEWERRAKRRELPFLLGHRYISTGEGDVTLATHLDYNRLDLLKKVLSHWDGPASVAIHVTDSQVQNVMDFLLNSKSLRERKNVSYHLVFRVGPSYPPNHGRELAHRFVSTPYMFILDVDFVPSHGLYSILKEKLTSNEFGSMDKTAVVIAAFETKDSGFKFPTCRSQMIDMYLNHKVHQFHGKYFYPGHGPTNYKKWISATEPYFVSWRNDYEPYYVVKKSVFTFDHRFVARFQNKASHSTELHMAGYKFLVFPESFIIHLPHKTNKQNMNSLRKCSRQWYKNWLKGKRRKYHYKKKDIRDFLVA